ncbi:BrnT family toxin [Acidithiobacillus sp. IBUN Pt1247-S3]|uniref:BrnT family toxin n=1 Tax=Acidithiobacillus sp. IBUN Pt1247-S3 TaxID=3166642 RepID=UPI0034E579D8
MVDFLVQVAGFLWDTGNWPKCGKHGVSRAEIEAVFAGCPAVFPDPCPQEPRVRAIGKNAQGRYLFIVFCLQDWEGQSWIRPISARYMHRKEIEHYEQQTA